MKKYSLFISLLLFVGCQAQTKYALSADEFEKGMSTDSAQILDVRTPAEFNSGHINNALLADWNDAKEFERRTSFINKKKPIYVYCLGGGRSSSAAAAMRKNGFINVLELKGGMNAWRTSNKNVVGKSNETQMTADAYNKAIANKIVLVDFGATWCAPCRLMNPILQSLEKKNAGKFTLVKVDAGKDEELVKLNNVTALPVFIIYKNGKQVWRKDGVATEEELAAVINKQ
jgi:thioredoxin